LFPHVNWAKTEAYAMGLNGIYLNLRGREAHGIVSPGPEADALLGKIRAALLDAHDPDSGKPMIGDVTFTRRDFHGGMLADAPDLIVGYMPGYRSSWQTALGAVPALVVTDNTDAWRADHCIAARFVPGVLISNRKSRAAEPHLYDLTVSLMEAFGVSPAAGMIGHSIY
jgi:predicted AlkP superfamily phosphohydrolase/phosphomutase